MSWIDESERTDPGTIWFACQEECSTFYNAFKTGLFQARFKCQRLTVTIFKRLISSSFQVENLLGFFEGADADDSF